MLFAVGVWRSEYNAATSAINEAPISVTSAACFRQSSTLCAHPYAQIGFIKEIVDVVF